MSSYAGIYEFRCVTSGDLLAFYAEVPVWHSIVPNPYSARLAAVCEVVRLSLLAFHKRAGAGDSSCKIKMRMFDTTKGLADVTLENIGSFVEWWLFWRGCDALYQCFHHPCYDDLLEAVKATLFERHLPIELVPVILAKAEHIKSIFEGDADLYEFVHAGR